MMSNRPSQAQWIEIDGAAIRQNLALLRSNLHPDTAMAAVVKSNAYGHGLACVGPVAAEHCEWLAVHRAEEARQIRHLGIRLPIMIMGFVPPSEI